VGGWRRYSEILMVENFQPLQGCLLAIVGRVVPTPGSNKGLEEAVRMGRPFRLVSFIGRRGH
jgi:hypothetical protein